jgi:spore germination cell wall hydrolase CwlJ-like protein
MISPSAACLAAFLLTIQAIAADKPQDVEAIEAKAQVLEQNAVDGGTVPRSETIKKAEVQAVDPLGDEPIDDAITCLSRTIYWEARSEGTAEMEAIASVVMNRLGHDGFPSTICKVVKQGHEQGACQFSWWCDGRSDRAREDESYAIAKEIARKALNKELEDRTAGGLYFHQHGATPSWSAQYIETAQIGALTFYKPREGKAR